MSHRRSSGLADQLNSAMAAVQLGGDNHRRLVELENAYSASIPEMPLPTELEKLKLIGEGGYSLVWLSKDNATGKQFALKQMHKAALSSRKGLGPEVAFREKAAFEELKPHPFIVRCFGCFQDPSSLFLLLELCVMDL